MARKKPVDYTDMVKKGESPKSSRTRERRDWWNLKGKSCAAAISSVLHVLERQQAARVARDKTSAYLYGNFRLRAGVTGDAESRIRAAQLASDKRLTFNVVQSAIDTLTSRVGETKPRPYYLTDGGNYAEQRKAKKLNKYIDGVLYQNRGYDLGLKAFRDGGIFGDGLIKVLPRGGRVVLERVLRVDLWVDEVEAQNGNPRRMHHVTLVDRDELLAYARAEDWPKESIEAIEAAQKQGDPREGLDTSDMVRVCESWNLAAPNAKGKMVGGRHAVSLPDESVMIQEPEDYPHDVFPFARIPWCEMPQGFWSQGAAEQLTSDQVAINKKLWLIERSMHLAGSFKVWIKAGSKVVKEQINNEVGSIGTYAGDTPPQYTVVQPIHEMYLLEVDRDIQRAYQKIGVSELSAQAQKPAGLNSGKALREFNDTESERFRTIQRQNDNLYLQLAHLIVLVSREMGKDLRPVVVPGARSTETIDFAKDIGSIDLSVFTAQCFPVSRLPKDPAGRLQTIQEYIQAGFMTPRQGRRALDFPDLESIESLANAQEDIICKTLDAICDEGVYSPPEPTDDLILAKQMCLEYIQRGRASDLEEERLGLLRRWSLQVDEMQKQVAMEAAKLQAAAQPQAVPMAPPQSDLIPNVPQVAA